MSHPMVTMRGGSPSRASLILLSLLFVLLFSAFSPLPQEPQEGTVLDNILRIATGFASLVGISALVGAAIALLRAVGVIQSDSMAGRITAGLNLLAFIVLVVFGVFRPDLSLDFLDSVAAQLAAIALFVLGFIVQIITPAPILRAFYQARVPLLGAVGERYEARAHYVRPMENEEPPQNWTTDRQK